MRPRVNRFFWLIHLSLLLVAAWLCAGILSRLLSHEVQLIPEVGQSSGTTHVDSPDQISKNYNIIVERNLFNSALSSPKGSKVDPVDIDPPPVVSSSELKVVLKGTAVSRDHGWSVVILRNELKRETRAYFPGDEFMEDASVHQILSDRVILERQGQLEQIFLQEKLERKNVRGSDPLDGDFHASLPNSLENVIHNKGQGKYELAKDFLQNVMDNGLETIITQGRAMPTAQGLRLFHLKPNSLFTKLGLKRNDTLESINGYSLIRVENILQVVDKLKSSRSFTLVNVSSSSNV